MTYLSGRAEFTDAGIREGSVWAVLRDGRQLVIPAEAFAPLPTASRASRGLAPRSTAEAEIPEGKAVLVNTIGVQNEGSEFGDLSLDLRGTKYTLFPTTGDYWRFGRLPNQCRRCVTRTMIRCLMTRRHLFTRPPTVRARRRERKLWER